MLLLCLALCAGTIGAQAVQHQQWTTEDGLPQDSVHALFQSSDGFLWIATEGGVARFDGTGFLILRGSTDASFTSNDVSAIAETPGGTLWFGTADGLIRYRAGTTARLAESAGLPSAAILALAPERAGSLLVLTAAGLARLSGDHAVPIPLPDGLQPSALSAAPDGESLILAGRTLLRAANGTLRPLRSDLPGQTLAVQTGRDGTLWLQTRTSILEQLPDGTSHTWQAGRELPGTRVESLRVEAGEVFAGINRGAFRIDPESSLVEPLVYIGPQAVLATLVDREGNRWFGTETSGLHVLRTRNVAGIPELENEVLTAVTEASDGSLWFGTRNDGLRRIAPSSEKKLRTNITPVVSAGLSSQVVLSLAPGTHGDLWAGTPDGLNHIHGDAVDHLTSANGLPDDFIRSLLAEEDGGLWIGTRRGLAHLEGGRVTATYTRAEGLESELIGTVLRTHDGDLWFATLSGLGQLHNGTLHVFTAADGLSGGTITALAEDNDGTLWVGTRQGGLSLAVADETGVSSRRFLSFSNPLLRQPAEALLFDGTGNLFLRNSNGIVRASVADLRRCAGIVTPCPLRTETFSGADGMPSVELSGSGHPVAIRTRDGHLWFTTRRGVAILDPQNLRENQTPPPVVIESFLLDGQSQPQSGRLSIAPGQHRFQFLYAGLSFAAPSRVSYRYRLEGFDRDWTEAGNRRFSDYTNLPAGHFRFLVEARNSDGVRSLQPAEVVFTVRPPFYRRWWFALLVLLLLGALVYAVYQLRLRRVQREFKAVLAERNRIAREIHDTLAQDFVGVSLQLEITAQLLRLQALDAAREQIDQTRTLVRNGIREARESIWALRANTAETSLPARLRDTVAAARSTGLTVRLEIGGAYRPLAEAAEGEILRIASEAIQNIRKHAGATEVEIQLSYQEEVIVLRICDNGRGFDLGKAEALAGHYGLRGMRERAGTIGATLEIDTAPGHGTTLTLQMSAVSEERK